MTQDIEKLLARIQHVTEFLGVELQDVNQRGIFGNTPLKVVAVWGDADAVRLLLDAGANINDRLEDGYTPLHHAASQGHLDVVRLLCERGAAADIEDDDGQTPLGIAKLLGQKAIAEYLQLRCGTGH
jgi:ankyrin repeat protein